MDDDMVLKEEDDEDVLVDDDLEGALGGGGEFWLFWEGGVVTSPSLVILGFLEMWDVDPCVEAMVNEGFNDDDELQEMLASVKPYIGKSGVIWIKGDKDVLWRSRGILRCMRVCEILQVWRIGMQISGGDSKFRLGMGRYH